MLDDLDDEAEGEVSSERWMVSYADFVTTLFALFVLLFALSLADAHHREGSALKQGYKSVARTIAAPPDAKKITQASTAEMPAPSASATSTHRGANDVNY
ncbi:MAG: flagellar motor protein MotB, partial [Candidatus Binataceae bacterium]